MNGRSSIARRLVLAAGLTLVLTWIGLNLGPLIATQNGLLRFSLTALFSAAILLRKKRPDEGAACRSGLVLGVSVAGTVLAVTGIVFRVHQLQWVGLLAVLFASLRWALSPAWAHDVLLSVLVLYWAHPIPSRLFDGLQIAMQTLSVRGAEWLLQVFNVRVWADGLVLRTSVSTYEVPQWCSGMRAATTVFLLALGLGVLKRLRWHENVVLVAAAVLQALILNVIRISVMVLVAPVYGHRTGTDFLHDTAGFIIIASVFLVYAEVLWWRRREARLARAAEDRHLSPAGVPSEHPPFWRDLLHRRRALAVMVTAIVLAAAAAFRSRPYHRTQMLRDVAEGLRDAGQLDAAQRAADLVLDRAPADMDWRYTTIRLLMMRGKFAEVLGALDRVPTSTTAYDVERRVLRAYALTFLDRLPEAGEIVLQLPEHIRESDPRVAMVLAELARVADNPDDVARYAASAAHWRPNLARIRSLYPYLRDHRKWNAILSADLNVPYNDLAHLLAAVEASMNLNRTDALAELTRSAVLRWPADSRLLEPLFYLTVKRWEPQWEELYGRQLAASLPSVENPDALFTLLERCFALFRPDLAWQVYDRIEEVDSRHPALWMAPARFGPAWFTFRRRYLGLNAPMDTDTFDMRPYAALGLTHPLWTPLCRRIPLCAELAVSDPGPACGRFLRQALAEFSRRDARAELSLTMLYQYALALDQAGDFEQARRLLTRIVTQHPEQALAAKRLLSEIYERHGDWQGVYEALRDYPQTTDAPNLGVALRLCRAELSLRLGLAAMHTARQAAAAFPQSIAATAALALTLSRHDSPEEALLVLERPRIREAREADLIEAQALQVTERFDESEAFCKATLISRPDLPLDVQQHLLLPPAELAALWHRVYVPGPKEFAANAEVLRANVATATSPFLAAMLPLWLECYGSKCSPKSADPVRWTACGRDNIEKALALNQLTLLLCGQQAFAEARAAAGEATRLFPASPLLWRIRISLSGADPQVLAAARAACPWDSEIWLADLVARTQTPNGAPAPDAILSDVRAAARSHRYTPAAMTRAGEYLLRVGMPAAATVAAREGVERARSLLPAYVLGIRCALKAGDREWALECVKKADEASIASVAGLYRTLIGLKLGADGLAVDADVVRALTRLRHSDPNNPLWAQMLGYVRFQRGGWELVDALYQMNVAIAGGATNRIPFEIGAEAARLLGNYRRAVDLLQAALDRRPNDPRLLNNLAYTLSMDPDRHAQALALIPQLLQRQSTDPNVLDTVAVAYLRNGKLVEAEETLSSMRKIVTVDSRLWFRTELHLAEVAFDRGDVAGADESLTALMQRSHGVPDEDVMEASTLAARVRELRGGTRALPGTNSDRLSR